MNRHSTSHTRPLAIVTCGPACVPLDSVRRITNFSTGEIGSILSLALADAGWDVYCLRGEGATAPIPKGVEVRPFSTNASLEGVLRGLDRVPEAIFHAAALSDFDVAGIEGASGKLKISSRGGELLLRLRPAVKLLPSFRGWFPKAKIVGWKYELDGTSDEAISKARQQIVEAKTDASVINGAAYGPGFGLVTNAGVLHCKDKVELAGALVRLFQPE